MAVSLLKRVANYFWPGLRPYEVDPYKDQWDAYWAADQRRSDAVERGDTEAAYSAFDEGEAIHQEILASKFGVLPKATIAPRPSRKADAPFHNWTIDALDGMVRIKVECPQCGKNFETWAYGYEQGLHYEKCKEGCP